MYIEARLNNAQTKQPCLICGVPDRLGEVAYFEQKSGEWVCDRCVFLGEEAMRPTLREAAESHRLLAAQYDAAAEGSIVIAEESEEVRKERERIRQEFERLKEEGREYREPRVPPGDDIHF